MNNQENFQKALRLSQEMLMAGRTQDWETLIALEGERSVLLAQTQAMNPSRHAAEITSLIHNIQVCDTELKEILTKMQEHTRILLRIPPT